MTLKSTLFAAVLAASLAAPAFANDAPLAAPLPQFTAADTQMLFEQDVKPMQLAALSAKEMKETEGEWFWLYFYGPQIATAATWLANTGWRTIPGVYHNIRQRW